MDAERFIPDLIRWESATRHMYRDTLGYVTVGIGNLVHDALEAIALPFQFDGTRPATPKEVGDDFLRVIGMPKGLPAMQYRSTHPPRVALTDDAVTALAVRRLENEFLPGLARLTNGRFETAPAPAQSALVDLCWNLGVHGLAGFTHLLEAVVMEDWYTAATSCHRKTSRDERNDWTREKFLEAAR